MATLVSSGQFTIIDVNDARTITASISTNGSTQQVFTKDESTISYSPNRTTSNLIFTPVISISGLTEAQVLGSLTNRKFTNTSGTELNASYSISNVFYNGSGTAVNNPFTATHNSNASSTLTLSANLGAPGTGSSTGVFDIVYTADFTDPITSIVSPIRASIALVTTRSGTNAVFISTRGKLAIEQSPTSTANVTAVGADLVRANGYDTTGITYKWYKGGGSTQIYNGSLVGDNKYGLATTDAGSNFAISGTPKTFTSSDLQTEANLGAVGGTSNNTLVISSNSVTDLEVFKVVVTDADSNSYVSYFTITDYSDPYEVTFNSTTGDRLVNGQGSTQITPIVKYGDRILTTSELSTWTFRYYHYEAADISASTSRRAAFTDITKFNSGSGSTITANSAYSGTAPSRTATISWTGAESLPAGSIIKCVSSNGTPYYFEVATAITAATTVTIRECVSTSANIVNTWLKDNYTYPNTANSLLNGKIYYCGTGNATTGGTISKTGSTDALLLRNQDVDRRSTITVEASKP